MNEDYAMKRLAPELARELLAPLAQWHHDERRGAITHADQQRVH